MPRPLLTPASSIKLQEKSIARGFQNNMQWLGASRSQPTRGSSLSVQSHGSDLAEQLSLNHSSYLLIEIQNQNSS